MLSIVTIETPELGDRSYLVHDETAALVVDPQRDVERAIEAAGEADVAITHVAETHLHNDYVSGGLDLARRTGADYLVSAAEDVGFTRRRVADGEEITVGSFTIEAHPTPGHTPHHLAYVVRRDGNAEAVLSGGSLLFGTVGRTDLSGAEHADALARAQFVSVRALTTALGDAVRVLPTHGFGSFCASGEPVTAAAATIGEERRRNVALTASDEDAFLAELKAGLGPVPDYYARIGPLNRDGPPAYRDEPPRPVGADEVARRLAAGEWVVDLRPRRRYAAAHLEGTLGFEHAEPFTTYLGWMLPAGRRLTLLGEAAIDIAEAARDLARIGVDELAAAYVAVEALAGDAGIATDSYEVTDFAGLASTLTGPDAPVVLDVRDHAEWEDGHLAGSVNLTLPELPGRLDELGAGRVFVHCSTGYRASVAASVLSRAGRDVVLVDAPLASAAAAGLALTN